jgi:HAMP domain-containing protein
VAERRSSPGRWQRLSWQLWTSHLLVVVITLLALAAALVMVVGSWLLRQGYVGREPALDAQVVGVAVGNLVRRGAPEPEISALLAAIQRGDVQLPGGAFEIQRGPRAGGPFSGGPTAGGPPVLRPDLQEVEALVIVGPDGTVLAASDRSRYPPGTAFPPSDQSAWVEPLARAWAGERDPGRLSARRAGSTGLGAYPILDSVSGRPLAVVALQRRIAAPIEPPFLVARFLAFVGLATLAALVGSSLFAISFSAVAAWLLSRRIGGRLERLSRAADALAEGDLAQRVPPGKPDELGLLIERFNTMAERLEQSRAALEAEKSRVEESLRTRRELVE